MSRNGPHKQSQVTKKGHLQPDPVYRLQPSPGKREAGNEIAVSHEYRHGGHTGNCYYYYASSETDEQSEVSRSSSIPCNADEPADGLGRTKNP